MEFVGISTVAGKLKPGIFFSN